MLYWENNVYMYWVKEQLCIKLLVAEAASAASAYLSSMLLLEQWIKLSCKSWTHKPKAVW